MGRYHLTILTKVNFRRKQMKANVAWSTEEDALRLEKLVQKKQY